MASSLLQPREQPRNRTPLYLVGVSVLIVSALVMYLELAPKPAPQEIALTLEAKAYLPHLQLSDVGMLAAKDYFGQKTVELEGNIANNGMRGLSVVEVTCVFRDVAGNPLLRQRAPIVSRKMGGLQPGEKKAFRLPFDKVPNNWNRQMPNLVIAGIEFQQ